jgi:hypothetical protein
MKTLSAHRQKMEEKMRNTFYSTIKLKQAPKRTEASDCHNHHEVVRIKARPNESSKPSNTIITVKYFQPGHVVSSSTNQDRNSNVFMQKYDEKKLEYEIPEIKDINEKVLTTAITKQFLKDCSHQFRVIKQLGHIFKEVNFLSGEKNFEELFDIAEVIE